MSGHDFSFVGMEREQLDFWRQEKIFQKSLEQTRGGRPYIFYDGPPFATGLPHHGHLVGGTLKDVVPRYWTMKGRYVERRFGWDCHGVPVEYEIDKKLGMHAVDAVKKLGVKGYNDECRGIVSRYTEQWREIVTRMGRWVDFDNDYKTMDISFMESVWWVFKKLWEKGLVYQGRRVLPFSTELGTVLSNFEAGMNYQDVQDPAVTVLFELEDEDALIAVWTTTPWTLPSNLALCVSPDTDYVMAETEGKKIYLAEAALERYKKFSPKVLKRVAGKELVNRRYRPLFPFFERFQERGGFVVLGDGYVTTDTGTGVVHLAPGFGEDDHRVMKEAGLEEVFACPVDDKGMFTGEVGPWAGVHVKKADGEIIRALKERGNLLHRETIVHSYPLCWRSDTPLIYKAFPSWYVRVESLREELLESNSQINWVPEHLKDGRFGRWLGNARDWSVSRNRVWGTPLPVWHNEVAGKHICIGSLEELKQYTGADVTDIHREWVDDLTFSLPGEEGEYRRVSEVLDCWFESGSMPYAQLHYPFERGDVFEQGFPAEFIAEGLDQTRGWFYTLTVIATALYGRPAFKNVIVNGIVSAKDGKKMSKRLKNYTPPMELMDKHGADALRLYLINSVLVRGEDMSFSDSGVAETVRKTLLPWYNAYKFFSTYAKVDGWVFPEDAPPVENLMDRWILSRLQTLKGRVEGEMESYHLFNVVPALLDFIEDMTNSYIRMNRTRFWGETSVAGDKGAAYFTLHACLEELSRIMAPFAPFIAEHIHRELIPFSGGREVPPSVHLCSYPVAETGRTDEQLERAVELMQNVVLLGRQQRNEKKVKVKIPLAKLVCIHRDGELLAELARFEGYIKSELNVKAVEYSDDERERLRPVIRPNLPVLGKRLGKRMGKFMNSIKRLSAEQIYRLEEAGSVEIDGERFVLEDFLIGREPRDGACLISNEVISIELDCNPTKELLREGTAREVVNRIQKTRKEMGLNVADRIRVQFVADGELAVAIEEHRSYIEGEVLAVSLEESKEKGEHSFEVEGKSLELTITRSGET